jgi:hypothetical protein
MQTRYRAALRPETKANYYPLSNVLFLSRVALRPEIPPFTGCKSKIKNSCPKMNSAVNLIFAQFLIDEASNKTGLHC